MTEILTPVRTPTLKLQLPLLSKLELTSRFIRNFLERFTQNTKRKKRMESPKSQPSLAILHILPEFHTKCRITRAVAENLYYTQGVELTK